MPRQNRGEPSIKGLIPRAGFAFDRCVETFTPAEGKRVVRAMKGSNTRIMVFLIEPCLVDIFSVATRLAYQRQTVSMTDFWRNVTNDVDWAKDDVDYETIQKLATYLIEGRYRVMTEQTTAPDAETSDIAKAVEAFINHVKSLGFADFLPNIVPDNWSDSSNGGDESAEDDEDDEEEDGATSPTQPISLVAHFINENLANTLTESLERLSLKRKIHDPAGDVIMDDYEDDQRPTKYQAVGNGAHNPTMDARASLLPQPAADEDEMDEGKMEEDMADAAPVTAGRKILEAKGARR